MSEDLSRVARTVATMRSDISGLPLELADLDQDPLVQFGSWMAAAIEARPETANVMTLATADGEGAPSARTVLLRGFDADGFLFFTNYESRKGLEIEANPRAALVFYWPELHRQVLVQGEVVRATEEESARYFSSRPLSSRLSAWASPQSRVIPDRSDLELRLREMEALFRNQEIPLPPFWGGFRVLPETIELWQGRPNRLHDRFRYSRSGSSWIIERLAP